MLITATLTTQSYTSPSHMESTVCDESSLVGERAIRFGALIVNTRL